VASARASTITSGFADDNGIIVELRVASAGAVRQPLLRSDRSGARRLFGLELWRLAGAQVAKDPRAKTLVLHNTGVLNDGPGAIPGMDVRKDVLQALHTPLIYVLGGPTDIAYSNGMDDFARIAHVPVAVANLPVGHGGTFVEPNGGAAASVAVGWLDWQLRGDTQSAGRFVGENCGLCQDAQWSLQRKQFPATASGH
jgi:hypothetical protein